MAGTEQPFDEAIAAGVRRGDPDALSEVYRVLSGPLTAYLRSQVRDTQLAEDLAYETLLTRVRGCRPQQLGELCGVVDVHDGEQFVGRSEDDVRARREAGDNGRERQAAQELDRDLPRRHLRRGIGQPPSEDRVVRPADEEGRDRRVELAKGEERAMTKPREDPPLDHEHAGFDLDGDGIGDLPYELRSLTAQLAARHPALAFFRGWA